MFTFWYAFSGVRLMIPCADTNVRTWLPASKFLIGRNARTFSPSFRSMKFTIGRPLLVRGSSGSS